MYIESEYAVARTIFFPLIDFGATDFESTPVTFAAGDTQISIDGGAFANSTNTPSHEGNGIYSLLLTAAEVTGKVIVVTLIDSATKEWEDQSIILQTINNSSAQIPLKDANVKEISDDSVASDNLESDYDGTGFNKSNSEIGICAVNTDMVAAAPTSTQNADALLKRDVDNVEATAPVHSFASMLLKLVSRFKAGTGETFRTDGSTVHMTQPVTSSAAADPITELGVAV